MRLALILIALCSCVGSEDAKPLRHGRALGPRMREAVQAVAEAQPINGCPNPNMTCNGIKSTTGTFSGTVTADNFVATGSAINFTMTSAGRIYYQGAGGNYVKGNAGGHLEGTAGFQSAIANGGDGFVCTNECEIQWPDTKIAEVGTGITITAATTTLTGGLSARNAAATLFDFGTAGSSYFNLSSGGALNMFNGAYFADPLNLAVGTGSATTAKAQGTLSVNTTGVGNVGASGPDDLQTYTLPANSLITTGRCIKATARGTTVNNANAKTVRMTIGPTPTALITKQLTASVAGFWSINCTICRTGASTQDYWCDAHNFGGTTVSSTDGATVQDLATYSTLTQTETNALDIKAQSTASTSNNDIVSEMLTVEAM